MPPELAQPFQMDMLLPPPGAGSPRVDKSRVLLVIGTCMRRLAMARAQRALTTGGMRSVLAVDMPPGAELSKLNEEGEAGTPPLVPYREARHM